MNIPRTTKKSTGHNLAFIDGQNMHLGTTQNGWKVDYSKFRTYLRDKYSIAEAYYFSGYVSEDNRNYTIIFKRQDL